MKERICHINSTGLHFAYKSFFNYTLKSDFSGEMGPKDWRFVMSLSLTVMLHEKRFTSPWPAVLNKHRS